MSSEVFYGAWKVRIAQFVSPDFVRKNQSCYPRRRPWPEGFWMRSISYASLVLSKKQASQPVLSLILNGNVQEYHYISSLAFAWPQTASDKRVILAGYNSLDEDINVEDEQNRTLYPSMWLEPIPLRTRAPKIKSSTNIRMNTGLTTHCRNKRSKPQYKPKCIAISMKDVSVVPPTLSKILINKQPRLEASTFDSFTLQSNAQIMNTSDHLVSTFHSSGNIGVSQSNNFAKPKHSETPAMESSRENSECLLLGLKSSFSKGDYVIADSFEGGKASQVLPTSTSCETNILACFGTRTDNVAGNGFLAQIPPRFSSYMSSVKSSFKNELKFEQDNSIKSSEAEKEEKSPYDALSPTNQDSIDFLSGVKSTLDTLGSHSSNVPSLKQQIMACFLDPTFQALVNEVEKVWLELESSMVDDIKGLRSIFGDV